MNKQRIIIFDFNRTLYDPEKRRLLYGAQSLLKALIQKNYALFLISTAVTSRDALIRELGLMEYFQKVIISQEKSLSDYKQILQETQADVSASYIIGDRVRQEITFGNTLGFQTIWFKKGKFRTEIAQSSIEQPTYTIVSLREVIKIVP